MLILLNAHIIFSSSYQTEMISVIIPMYNARETILRAIKSVLNQTYTGAVEVIVVDDGSKDDSYELVNDFCITNDITNVKVIRKSNGGVSTARNAGMREANGSYIALLDSDDEWSPEKLSIQTEVLKNNPAIDFIGSNRNNEKISFPYKVVDGLVDVTLLKLLLKVKPQTSTAVFKRKVIDEVGLYDEQQRYAEDANYWMRISSRCNMKMLPDSLVITDGGKRNYGVKGLSSNMWGMQKGELKNIKEMYQDKRISLFLFIPFYLFSIIKYIKRVLIVSISK